MIKLNKTAAPEVLTSNGEAWLEELTDAAARGEDPTATQKSRYRHPDIKSSLIHETSGKCAYCESKFEHVTYGDVEHILPKSGDVARTFQWENLTIACDRCNTNKASHEDIVDPYIEDPDEFFSFLGPMVVPVPHSEKARFTEQTLKLNRAALFERRKERINQLNTQLVLLAGANRADLRQAIRRDLEETEMSDGAEYAAISRSFLLEMLSKIDAAALPVAEPLDT